MKKNKKKPVETLDRFKLEYNRDAIIPLNLFVGMKWNGDGKDKYEVILSHDQNVARLHTSSYVGTCAIGAIHYYARISVRSANVSLNGDAGGHGGYLGKNSPDVGALSIQVERQLEKMEYDADGEPIGKIGDWTYRFNTEKEAYEAGIAWFKRKFAPGWVLHEEYGDKEIARV